MRPVEPPPSDWNIAEAVPGPDDELVAIGADLEPGTLLDAYRAGLFPMGLGDDGAAPLGWWSPDPRGILRPDQLHISRSLRRSLRTFEVTWDVDFPGVVAGCADPTRTGRWITPEISEAYGRLHDLGWAHSVEVWQQGRLVGGLYGVCIGGLFCGESMFRRVTDASKAALVGLVQVLNADADPRRIIDVQWQTEHLSTLGVQAVPRTTYRRLLEEALQVAPPAQEPGTGVALPGTPAVRA